MKEIELKVLNINKNQVLGTLRGLKAKREMQPTLITELAFRRNSKQPFLLRLRKKGDVSELTYKKKIHSKKSRFKIEEEIETEVGDFNETKKILEQIGFKVFRHRQKIREEFECRGVEVEIDTYPGVKPYMELEGSPKNITRLLKKLGYSLKDTSKETATEILRRLGKNPDLLIFKND